MRHAGTGRGTSAGRREQLFGERVNAVSLRRSASRGRRHAAIQFLSETATARPSTRRPAHARLAALQQLYDAMLEEDADEDSRSLWSVGAPECRLPDAGQSERSWVKIISDLVRPGLRSGHGSSAPAPALLVSQGSSTPRGALVATIARSACWGSRNARSTSVRPRSTHGLPVSRPTFERGVRREPVINVRERSLLRRPECDVTRRASGAIEIDGRPFRTDRSAPGHAGLAQRLLRSARTGIHHARDARHVFEVIARTTAGWESELGPLAHDDDRPMAPTSSSARRARIAHAPIAGWSMGGFSHSAWRRARRLALTPDSHGHRRGSDAVRATGSVAS